MAENKATNVHWHEGNITRDERWNALRCKGATLWFTGLSASGKSTIAVALGRSRPDGAARLPPRRRQHPHGLNKNLGFSAEDCRQHPAHRRGRQTLRRQRRHRPHLLHQPPRADRDLCRELHKKDNPTSSRSSSTPPSRSASSATPRPLKPAPGRSGFTGIDDPYEAPNSPNSSSSPPPCPSELRRRLRRHAQERGLLKGGCKQQDMSDLAPLRRRARPVAGIRRLPQSGHSTPSAPSPRTTRAPSPSPTSPPRRSSRRSCGPARPFLMVGEEAPPRSDSRVRQPLAPSSTRLPRLGRRHHRRRLAAMTPATPIAGETGAF